MASLGHETTLTIPFPDPALPSNSETSDQSLVDRIRASDEAAFEMLVRRYAESLCDWAERYIGSRDAANDLVQEVFCRLWERRQQWYMGQGLKTFLYKATRNLALDQLRHRQVVKQFRDNTPGHDVALRAFGQPAAPVDEQLEYVEIEQGIAHAIAQLPERCRLVYTLRWQHHLSYPEIAEVMGISLKAVEMHHMRGAKVLRALLARFLP